MTILRELSERLATFVNIGNPKARAIAVYDLATKVRNFGGDLAMRLADKSDPYGEMASRHPKVKSTGKKKISAMEAFSKAVFDTEKSIDISPRVRGRLREERIFAAMMLLGRSFEEINALTDEQIDELMEKSQPKLNKYDPGSLLGWTVHLLSKEGLDDAADEVRKVSRHVSQAWQQRER